ncbi:MAG: hypothetical protein LUE12_03315 [Ruminococcus sp.]|nr:hypothetical protein [Ruminococcus sp.]
MDKERFDAACQEVIGAEHERNGIGTLSEKTLHAVLKRYIEPNTENHEVKIGKYFADVVGENGIFEIQTGSFTPLRPKLECLLDYTDVTVVYPMAAVKYLTWLDPETGEVTKPRRCPSKKPIDAFYELVKIKYTLDNPHFHLKLIMLEIHEQRIADGWSYDGKRGSHRIDRFPAQLLDELDFHTPSDFDYFIPCGLDEEFTISEFAKTAKTSYECAQRALSVLCYLERTKQRAKRGKEKLFVRNE